MNHRRALDVDDWTELLHFVIIEEPMDAEVSYLVTRDVVGALRDLGVIEAPPAVSFSPSLSQRIEADWRALAKKCPGVVKLDAKGRCVHTSPHNAAA